MSTEKYERVESIKRVLNGNLDETSPREELFVGLENTTLRKHQKTLLYHMKKLENDTIKIDDKFELNTNFGVLGDLVGAGKSLPILLLILNNKDNKIYKDIYHSYSKYCNVSAIEYVDNSKEPKIKKLNSSLLVVPHTLVRQWKGYADNFVPSLKYKIINKSEHLLLKNKEKDGSITNKYNSIEEFIDSDLIILSATFYSQFMKLFLPNEKTYIQDMEFIRVIFDEADSINIPSCYKPTSKFYWFITSSILNLMCPYRKYWGAKLVDGIRCSGFIKSIFYDLDIHNFPFYDYIFFKNKETFIQTSLELPKPIIHKISCFTPPAVKVLKGIVDPKIIQMIQGDDLKGAMEQVDTMKLSKSTDDIIKLSTDVLLKDIEKKEKEYTYKSSLKYSSEDVKKKSLENIKLKIDEIKNKIKLIESRIQNKFCLVCNGDAEIPTITLCCKNVFCLNCINYSYKENPICPFCRSNITEKDICIQSELKEKIIDNEIVTKEEPKLLNKMDTLLKIIIDKPDGKFLVVSQYDNSLSELYDKFKEKKIKTSKLSGNSLVVNKTLSTFKDPESDLNIILLNASNYGSGLNIPETTDIIIYHKLTQELETQVIGRAQRYPRTTVLNIWYLISEGEYD